MLISLPFFHFIRNTTDGGAHCTLKLWFFQKILGFNRGAYWPVDFRSKINQWKNIHVGIDSAPGIEPGCYIQGIGKIYIGNYTRIAQNVGIVSANHSLTDSRNYSVSSVNIGNYCWIGMNSVVLPGVVLGDYTVVAAGSVVTKSFEDGYGLIAGVPAKLIRKFEAKECVSYSTLNAYHGYIPDSKFLEFKSKKLWVS
jgi:acetyltransferase-like isoleucine patch superfamily enzyme